MWLFELIFSGLWFCGGAIIASFWACMAYRGQRGISPWGRSKCEKCGRQLRWSENIPVISYFLLKGECGACGGKIPLLYPLWEVSAGCWTMWWVKAALSDQTWGLVLAILAVLWLVGMVLIWIALVDIWEHEVATNWLWCLAVLTVMGISLAMGEAMSVTSGAWLVGRLALSVGVWLFFYLLNVMSKRIWGREGIGSGDGWMMAIMSWWLNWEQVVVALLAAFWLGAIVGVVLLATARKKRLDQMAFLPFLVMGLFIAWRWGEVIWRWFAELVL